MSENDVTSAGLGWSEIAAKWKEIFYEENTSKKFFLSTTEELEKGRVGNIIPRFSIGQFCSTFYLHFGRWTLL